MVLFYNEVHMLAGAKRCTWKFAEFHENLHGRGVLRQFTGKEAVCSQQSRSDHVLCYCFTWWKKPFFKKKNYPFLRLLFLLKNKFLKKKKLTSFFLKKQKKNVVRVDEFSKLESCQDGLFRNRLKLDLTIKRISKLKH